MKIEKITLDGKKETIEVADRIFAAKINNQLVSNVLYKTNANYKGRKAKTKQKNEIIGSTAKIYAQKGTGNARAGTRTSPIWRGGGVIFGPTPKDWSISVPKKVRKLALLRSIIYKLQQDSFTILDKFSLDSHKTKNIIQMISGLNLSDKILIISDEENDNLILSTRNIKKIKLIESKGVNVYDLLNFKSILTDKTSLLNLIERIK